MSADARFNPLEEWELDLREINVDTIENLGATKDGFDCIDLTANSIGRLENLPRLLRLRTLLLANNRISRLSKNIGPSVPNLHTLVLTGNRIGTLSDLLPLARLKNLYVLSLVKNPVTTRPQYRAFVVNMLPALKVLDFYKVHPAEREAAALHFKSAEGKKLLAAVVRARYFMVQAAARRTADGSSSSASSGAAASEKPLSLSAEQLAEVQQAIEAASSAAEVEAIEAALKSGNLPAALLKKMGSNSNSGGISATGGGDGSSGAAAGDGLGQVEMETET